MELERIYQPITQEMKNVEDCIAESVTSSKNRSILAISNHLLQSRGKRLRPALVILSQKAVSENKNGYCKYDDLARVAAAVELIHLASLVHDDVLDGASLRRNKPTLNATMGNDVSIAFGDYIYSKAFELIGKCRNPDVFECVCQAIHVMCEGELIQVCRRGNASLSTDSYIAIVRKKTASLFAACCQTGAIMADQDNAAQTTLREFGLNFGIAFQIIDDCKDIIGKKKTLGKRPGQDVVTGDITLPLLNLLKTLDKDSRKKICTMLESQIDKNCLKKIRGMLVGSHALNLTQQTALDYADRARNKLVNLEDSVYKNNLSRLADYITQS